VNKNLTQTCKLCKKSKPLSAFGVDRARPTGRHVWCKDCRNSRQREHYAEYSEEQKERHRWRVIKSLYGLTKDEFMALYTKQRGLCAICLREIAVPEGRGSGRGASMKLGPAVVDRDHKTSVVRGLLCNDCNIGLGRFGDDPARLNRAARYLLKHKG